jgi:hypothetical protein
LFKSQPAFPNITPNVTFGVGVHSECPLGACPVYGWFTEGFDTLDLKEAKALLDELHA